jgi:hypothetical protein
MMRDVLDLDVHKMFKLKSLLWSVNDYSIFVNPPETSFLCDSQIEGYYADPESDCQAFHICANDGNSGLLKYSFLCPNGTLFNQQYFICDWWFNVDCAQAEGFYSLNADIAAAAAAAGPGGDDLSGNARRGSRDFSDVSDITDINNLNLDGGRRNNNNNNIRG